MITDTLMWSSFAISYHMTLTHDLDILKIKFYHPFPKLRICGWIFLGILLGRHQLYPELWWGPGPVWLGGAGRNPDGPQTGRLWGGHSRHPGVCVPVLHPPRQAEPPCGAHHESSRRKIPPALSYEPCPHKLLHHRLVWWVGRWSYVKCGSSLLLQCWVYH